MKGTEHHNIIIGGTTSFPSRVPLVRPVYMLMSNSRRWAEQSPSHYTYWRALIRYSLQSSPDTLPVDRGLKAILAQRRNYCAGFSVREVWQLSRPVQNLSSQMDSRTASLTKGFARLCDSRCFPDGELSSFPAVSLGPAATHNLTLGWFAFLLEWEEEAICMEEE